jgi:secreted trypsin-like serine protease
MKHLNIGAISIAATVFLTSASAKADSVEQALRGLQPSSVIEYTRMVGGETTPWSEWPWQTALYRVSNGRNVFTCGGSLVAPGWVLSAAHCFGEGSSNNPADWTVATHLSKASMVGLPPDAEMRKVKRLLVHEGYDKNTQENDIALMELAETLPEPLIALQLEADPAEESNRSVTVTGWGMTRWVVSKKDASGHVSFFDGVTNKQVDLTKFESPDLRKADIPLVEVDQCAQAYHGVAQKIDGRNLCAGLSQGGVDACQGDSGGPMMTKSTSGEWRQIGVVSWGYGCAVAHYPGVYTRVSAFSAWIKNVMSSEDVAAGSGQSSSPPAQPTVVAENVSNVSAAADNAADASDADPALQNPAGVTIAFKEGDDVSVGQRVSYVVTTERPGYLTVFDGTPDGKLTQIYPNAMSLRSPGSATLASTLVHPDKPVVIPDYRNPYRGFDVKITEPRGKGIMVAMLTDQPLKSFDTPQAPKTFGSPEEGVKAIHRLRDELAANLSAQAKSSTAPSWSVAYRAYNIR